MSTTLTVPEAFAIECLDATGKVISPTPAFDAPPTWTDSNPAAVAIQEPANDLTATLTPVAPGSAAISVTVHIGGTAFSATLDVVVPPPTVASIQIVPVA